MTRKQIFQMFYSFIRVFISAIILQIMGYRTDGMSMMALNWEDIWQAGVVATLPVIYRFFNPNDPGYGVQKDTKIVNK